MADVASSAVAPQRVASPNTPSVDHSDHSNVSTTQEESEEVWCDARDTSADDPPANDTDDLAMDDLLDEEDRDRSGSVPGIDLEDLAESSLDGKNVPENIITTSFGRPSSIVASPVDEDSNGVSSAVADNNGHGPPPPPAQSTPELATALRSLPRSAQSMDFLQSYNGERSASPTPTYQSSGLQRQNSRRRSTVEVCSLHLFISFIVCSLLLLF